MVLLSVSAPWLQHHRPPLQPTSPALLCQALQKALGAGSHTPRQEACWPSSEEGPPAPPTCPGLLGQGTRAPLIKSRGGAMIRALRTSPPEVSHSRADFTVLDY